MSQRPPEKTARLLTVPEVAERLSVTERTVRAWLTIGDRVFVSMADITALTRTSHDAARKLIRVKKIKIYKFGRLKYVLLDDLMEAMEHNSPAEAA